LPLLPASWNALMLTGYRSNHGRATRLLFSEKNLAVDAGAGKKSSESLFKRILSYFATKK